MLITLAAARPGFIGAWEDLWVDQPSGLHPDLHPRLLRPGRLLSLARVAGLAAVNVEVALDTRHGNSLVLLLALALAADAGAVLWLTGRPRRAGAEAAGLTLMAGAGGLLAALQHGSAALAFPALAVAQATAAATVLEAVAITAVGLAALEIGVIAEGLGASGALGYAAVVLGSALLGVTRRQYIAEARGAAALVEQTRRTEAESKRVAALDERTRIAREIHDVLAHALGGLSVQLESAELLLAERGDVEGALERIASARRTAREGLEEARRAVSALRADMPPLPESLAGLMRAHAEQGGRGELGIEGTERDLAPEVRLTLLRTVQEALTNARRHAAGSAVTVRLIYEPQSTSVTVFNDAPVNAPTNAEPAPSGGYGLTGMRERLELAGGILQAGPEPDGWAVHAEVPA